MINNNQNNKQRSFSTRRVRAQRGQGLVEYALILSLVSVIVIIAAFALGLAIQRIYGIAAGAIGAKKDATKVIEITSALCIADSTLNKTGLFVTGFTTESYGNLVGSTNLAVGTGLNGVNSPVTMNPQVPATNAWGNSFAFNPLLSATTADAKLCPVAATIQANDGQIAVAPVVIESY